MISILEPQQADKERLTRLAGALRRYQRAIRYVDYRQAERDCELLAAKIRAEFTPSDLDRAAFCAIPRGGMIVLGMLSYLLDLRPAQLQAAPPGDGLLFVVDDCALTGARFASYLAQAEAQQVAFVHLYSHRALRQAIRDLEPRVTACLSSHDLADLPSANGPAAWRQWRERLGGKRYWCGPLELVCFAWSEPDHPFWNSATATLEDGWRWLPPHLCLKTRSLMTGPSGAGTLARQWQAPAHVVRGEFDGILWLCQTQADRIYSLSGVGADVWRLLAAWGNPEAAAIRLTELYQVDAETAARDVDAFTAELASAGLLERAGGGSGEVTAGL